MRHTIGLGLLLMVFWLIVSARFDPLLLGFGFVSFLLVMTIAHRMDVVDHEGVPLRTLCRVPGYWPWLTWEIIKSNVAVARVVLSPRMPVRRTLLRVPTGPMGPVRKAIYANSITLTPGTVSLDIEGDTILVHALDAVAADGLREGGMGRRILRMGPDN